MKRCAILVLALALPLAARAQDAAAMAKETLANLATEEAKAPKGHLTLAVSDRRGEKKGLETDSEMRKRIGALPGGTADGSLAFSAEGWCKELQVPASGQNAHPMRVRTAESGGVLRNLMQVQDQGKEQAYGRVIKITTTAPADAILTHRAAKSLAGVTWTSALPGETGLVLEGKRGEENHTVTVAPKPVLHVVRWTLSRSLTSPDGRTIQQSYDCRVETTDDGTLRSAEEWMTVGAPVNSGTLRVTEVKKSDPGAELRPEDLTLRFPRGTHVVDSRFGVPAEYDQTAEGVNEEEVSEYAKAFAQDRAKVGDAAPNFELKDPEGKVSRLQDLRGQVVVLYWFNTTSRLSQDSAGAIRELDEKFHKRGVRVLALSIGESGDGETIEEFRKRNRWTFPVILDVGGEAMRRYGLVAGVPKVAVVDKEGKLGYVQPGADIASVTALLEKLAGTG